MNDVSTIPRRKPSHEARLGRYAKWRAKQLEIGGSHIDRLVIGTQVRRLDETSMAEPLALACEVIGHQLAWLVTIGRWEAEQKSGDGDSPTDAEILRGLLDDITRECLARRLHVGPFWSKV